MKSPLPVLRYTLFGLSGDNRVHSYITSVTWHWPFRRHSDFILHLWLHFFCIFVDNIFAVSFYHGRDVLCARKANLILFLLKIAWSLLDFWRFWSIKFKNRLAVLVETFVKRLNQMMSWEQFRFCLMSFLSAWIKIIFL